MIDRRLAYLQGGLAAGLLLVVAGCSDAIGVNEGRVRFVLSAGASAVDAEPAAAEPLQHGDDGDDRDHGDHKPSWFFKTAKVTFSSILARNLEGVLVNVAMDLPVPVDVVTMEGGREVTLPDGELPPATYDQVVVVMTEVQVVTHDGTTITIEPPGGGWTSIIAICPFDVEEGETTMVSIQFDLKQAFSRRAGRFHFKPRFVCEEDAPAA